MNNQENNPFKILKNLFKKPRVVNKNDLGIYHYVWVCDSLGDDSNGQKYDVSVKLKAIQVYDSLVEIEVIDTKINESASQDIINIIKASMPKYINPKYIRWEVK